MELLFFYFVLLVCFTCGLEFVLCNEIDKDLSLHYHPDINANKNNAPPRLGWKDPFDMLGENHQHDHDNLFTYNEVLNNQLKHHTELCHLHLSRFVNLLRRAIELQINTNGPLHTVNLEFIITNRQLEILRQFGNPGKDVLKLEMVSDVISKLFTETNLGYSKVTSKDKILGWLEDILSKITNSPEWTVVISSSIMLFTTIWFICKTHSYRQALVLIFLTIFFSGFGFTWIRMYEEKEVERYLDSVTHGGNAPYHCRGEALQWYENIYYRMFGADCLQFYKNRDIRPMVKISPTEVFAETISSLFINPVNNAGIAYGNFINSIGLSVPWWLKPVAMLIGVIIPPLFFFIILLFCFNYKISCFFNGFHIAPSWSRKTEEIKCAHSCHYVSDLTPKENKSHQEHSDLQSLLSGSPLIILNQLGLKKILSEVNLMNSKENATVSDNDNQHCDDIKELKNDQHDDENQELENDDLKLHGKPNSKKQPRSIHTIREGDFGERNLEENCGENDEYQPVIQALGDHINSITIKNTGSQSVEK